MEILTDPGHPEHSNRLEWLGLSAAHEFDPATVDLAKINQNLLKLATVQVQK